MIPLPPLMSKHHQKCGSRHGFFFVNGSNLLHKKSRKIDFMLVQACNNRGRYKTTLGLKKLNNKYKDRGFTIKYYHGDNEFEHLLNFLAPDHLHTYAANEHIGDIERSICTIKERVRCGCHCIPHKKLTK